jgi:hypothetical protein
VKRCIALLMVLVLASLAIACDYTIRDIGYVVFAPPKLRMVVLFHERLDEQSVRASQRELASSAQAVECLAWNVSFHSGRLANLVEPTEAQSRWASESAMEWSCWLVRDDGASRLLSEGTMEQPPQWTELLNEHLQRPLSVAYREQAMLSFAQMIVFESTDPAANDDTDKVIARSLEALGKAASLLPRPVTTPVKSIRVPVAERADYETLLWLLHCPEVPAEQPLLCLLYGRGRLAGPVLQGTDIQVDSLLSQLVLVGQSCECGTQRNWVQYPQLPLAWPEELQSDMTHHLGFDPANAVVVEEVKRIIQRGPQNLTNGRDDVSDVVSTTLSIGGSNDGSVQATVIQGDGWGFDEPESSAAPAAVTPRLLAIPRGRQASLASDTQAESAANDTLIDAPVTATGVVSASTSAQFSPVILAALLAAGAACVAVLFFTKVSSRTHN